MTNVLVTGAAGFIGRRLTWILARHGYRVSGLDSVGDGHVSCEDFKCCDLTDEVQVNDLDFSAPFDAIVHLAGVLPGTHSRARVFAINVGGTSAVLDRFGRPDCHFLQLSTGLVYGRQPGPFSEGMACHPVDPYAQSKLAAETLVRSWDFGFEGTATVLRPSVVYGTGAPPRMFLTSLLTTLRRGEPFEMTAGDQLRDFIHVDDVVRAVELVLERRMEGTFNLATGKPHRLRDVAELAARVAGRPELLHVGTLPYRDAEIFDYRLDASALLRSTGFNAELDLRGGIEDMWSRMS